MFIVTTRSIPWWSPVIRGIVAILFGLAALIWPGITLIFLIALYGAYAIVDGLASLVGAFQAAERQRSWWALLLGGIVSILAGIVAFVWPGITALVLLFVIGAWAVVTGILAVIAAFRFGSWLLGLAGVLSVLFGVILYAFPGAGALSLVWLIGAYALIFGILLVLFGISLHSSQGQAAL